MAKGFSMEFSPIRSEDDLIQHYRKHLLNHLVTVFIWEGLPEGVPSEYIEMTLFVNGVCGFLERAGSIVPVRCTSCEKPDEYYRGTKYIYANPVLGSGELDPDAVVFNDRLGAWFPRDGMEVIEKYAALLASADVSIKIALKNSRLTHIAVTDNDDDLANVNKMFEGVANGATATAVSSKTLIGEGLRVLPGVTFGADFLRQLAETREYLYNLFLSEFGIHANTILKRERQLTGEIDMQAEKPVFNVESMLTAREEGVKNINQKYGTNIRVYLNPKYRQVEEQMQDDGTQSEEPAELDAQSEEPAELDAQSEEPAETVTQSKEPAETDTQSAETIINVNIDVQQEGGDAEDETKPDDQRNDEGSDREG